MHALHPSDRLVRSEECSAESSHVRRIFHFSRPSKQIRTDKLIILQVHNHSLICENPSLLVTLTDSYFVREMSLHHLVYRDNFTE